MNPIVFQKSGTGANPLITAYPGITLAGTNTPDGIWSLNGSDFVTIDGIDLKDPTSNNTPTLEMEYGYGLFKASGTNGANNNMIRNCTITLNRNNNLPGAGPFYSGSQGIALMDCGPTMATISTTVTALSGASSNNKFYSNTVQNVNCCIAICGYAAATPLYPHDINNDIGGNAAGTANNFINFGGGTGATNPACGVAVSGQWNFNVSFNNINNNNGSGVNHGTVNRGILTWTSPGASGTINNNSVTIKGGGTTSNIYAIENQAGLAGSGNTININNNTITNCTNNSNTSGSWYGIWNNNSSSTNLNIQNNVFSNNTDAMTTGNMYLISITGLGPAIVEITGNQLSESFPGTIPFTGFFNGIYFNANSPAANINIYGNNFSNFSNAALSQAAFNFIFLSSGTSCSNLYINSNTWTNLTLASTGSICLILNYATVQGNLATSFNSIVNGFNIIGGSGSMACISSSALVPANHIQEVNGNNFSNVTANVAGYGGFTGISLNASSFVVMSKQSVTNNTISNINFSGTGQFSGILAPYMGIGTTDGSVCSGNTITNVTVRASTLYSIFIAGSFSQYSIQVSGNTIENIMGPSSTTLLYCCFLGNCDGGINFYNNKISGLHSGGQTSVIWGVYVSAAASLNIYNNFISDLSNPASNPYYNNIPSLTGIYIQSGGNVNVYNNTIFMNAPGPGSLCSTAGIFTSTSATLDLRNNIVVNSSTPGPSGRSVAYWRGNNTLSSYSIMSNNNDFYCGTPGPRNLIFYDGTNSDQTLSAYQTRVAPRDAASVTEYPPFVNVSVPPYDVHMINNLLTLTESHGSIITTPPITTDIDVDPRYPNPGYPDNPSFPASAPDIGADEFAGGLGLPLPAVITNPATNITPNSAQLNGTVNPNGYNSTVTFQWGATTAYGNTIQGIPGSVNGSTVTAILANLTGLAMNQVYHYRICATNMNGTGYGADQSFTTVCPLPGPAGSINGPINVCQNGTGYHYSVGTIPNATSYQWSLPPGGTITSGGGTNSIMVSFSASASSGNITVVGAGLCGTGVSSNLPIIVNPIPVPTITGTTSLCINSGYYDYMTESGFTNYQWIISPGGNITWGYGTNQVQVTWSAPGPQWIAVNYTSIAGCSGAIPTILNVTVEDIPSFASSISGVDTVCAGTFGTVYSTPSITGADTYIWTLPAGAMITNGFGTNTIAVEFSNSAVSGDIMVYGNNLCGNGVASPAFPVTVNPLPVTPIVTISGDTLISSASFGNQWYYSQIAGNIGTPIPGATAQTYLPTQNGYYRTIVILEGCISEPSNPIQVTWDGINGLSVLSGFSIYPIPNNGFFTLSFNTSEPESYSFILYDNLGSRVFEKHNIHGNGVTNEVIDLRGVAQGIYSALFSDGVRIFAKKIIIQY
ncbi:MAG: T9SS type A sorting domain-containing protein [Bacteroidota bacterium]